MSEMTRFELEEWCEKFLKKIFDNSQIFMPILMKMMTEEIEEDEAMRQIAELSQNSDTYTTYKKELADFIQDFAHTSPLLDGEKTE